MLQIENIKKKYDTSLLFSSDTFSLENGLFLMVGKSGAGKTTFFNMISGRDRDYDGKILLDNKPIKDGVTKNIGYLTQDAYLVENKSILWHFRCIVSKNKDKKRQMNYIVEQLELDDLLLQYPEELSNGEKKRVMFALLYLSDCDIYLLDEPFADLDAYFIDVLKKFIVELSKNKLVIFSSHIIIEDIRIKGVISIEDNSLKFQATDNVSDIEDDHKQIKKRHKFRGLSFKSILLRIMCCIFVFNGAFLLNLDRASFFSQSVNQSNLTSCAINNYSSFSNLELVGNIASKNNALATIYATRFNLYKNDTSVWPIYGYVPINNHKIEVDYGEVNTLQKNEIIISDVAAHFLIDQKVIVVDNAKELIGKTITSTNSGDLLIKGIINTNGMKVVENIKNAHTSSEQLKLSASARYYCFSIQGYDDNLSLDIETSKLMIFFSKNTKTTNLYRSFKRQLNLTDENIKLDDNTSTFNDPRYEGISYTLIAVKYFISGIFFFLALGLAIENIYLKNANIKRQYLLFYYLGASKKRLKYDYLSKNSIENTIAISSTLILSFLEIILMKSIKTSFLIGFEYLFVPLFMIVLFLLFDFILLKRVMK